MKISKMAVTLVDHMGSDLSVVNAARVSMHKEHKEFEDNDVKLINYLAKHNHWSPFAHAFVCLRINIPLFIAMQLDKHTVGLVSNSVSRRYVDAEPEFWFTNEWRGRAENVKQGSAGILPNSQEISNNVLNTLQHCLDTYTLLIDSGVCPEQARIVLPMNTMMERVWSGSLAAFSRVCKLRLDPHSQKEIQELAGAIAGLVEPLFPVSWAALQQHE